MEQLEQKSRYSVSRKGMGGRKRKYSDAMLTEVLELVKQGKSLLAVSKEKGVPYVSIRAALKAQKMWPVQVPTVQAPATVSTPVA
jgi:hypothetical protein